MSDQRYPRALRLRRQKDFQRVYQQNAYAADKVLVVQGALSGLPHARLGLSIPRKTGNAVLRNRWKRLIRETFRRVRAELPAGVDLVVRPRRGASPQLEAIRDSLPRLARRVARHLRQPPPGTCDRGAKPAS